VIVMQIRMEMYREWLVRLKLLPFIALAALLLDGGLFAAQEALILESKMQLGNIRGRLDHMAVDLARQRLFVAQLENDSVGVIDFVTREIVHVITDVTGPQGLGYAASSDTLFVANGHDGSLRMFAGPQYRAVERIDLGAGADNVRFDASSSQILVSYGKGGLAVIDAASRQRIQDIPLSAQAESFQLDRRSSRIYVNSPKENAVVVLDRATGKRIATWQMEDGSNFPLALNEAADHVLVVFRNPPRLVVLAAASGAQVASTQTCGDADDIFVDAKRGRAYVSCGNSFVDVIDTKSYQVTARVTTVQGARTSLFVPEIDRLFVAARATPQAPASIWVFRPQP
jgi:DNA-binding beta-propeller fold protein YncE